MDFLMPFIGGKCKLFLNSSSFDNNHTLFHISSHSIVEEKPVVRRLKPNVMKTEPASTSGTTTVTIVKKDRNEEQQTQQTGTILYSAPNTITYNVVAATTSKDSSQEKQEVPQQTQDIQQYYNAGVKIIGEDYITTYQPGEQIIYQATSTPNVEEQQIQHQDCIQEQHDQQQECVQQNESKATLIPIPNINNLCTDVASSPTEASDLYFLIGLLPDFRNLSHDQKRKVKIGILKVLDDAIA